MNIFESKTDASVLDKPEIEQVQQEKQEYKLLGSYHRTAGLRLFCYNPHNDSVEMVDETKSSDTCIVEFLKRGHIISDFNTPKITVDPNWDYFEVLNLENAIKRVMKYKNGEIKKLSNLQPPRKSTINLFN